MLQTILDFLAKHIATANVLITIFCLFFNRYGHGIHKYPGPFLASLSSAWRLFDVYFSTDRIHYNHLHERYGSVVRLGPKKLSFSSSAAVKDVYSITQKGDMHLVAQQTSRGSRIQTLFATTDIAWHDALRSKVSQAFSMTAMVQYEQHVTKVVESLLDQLSARFASTPHNSFGGPFDFSCWIHYFTEDAG